MGRMIVFLSLCLRTSTGVVSTRTLGTRTWPGKPAEVRVPEDRVPVPSQERASACLTHKVHAPFVLNKCSSQCPTRSVPVPVLVRS